MKEERYDAAEDRNEPESKRSREHSLTEAEWAGVKGECIRRAGGAAVSCCTGAISFWAYNSRCTHTCDHQHTCTRNVCRQTYQYTLQTGGSLVILQPRGNDQTVTPQYSRATDCTYPPKPLLELIQRKRQTASELLLTSTSAGGGKRRRRRGEAGRQGGREGRGRRQGKDRMRLSALD
jgi:hypothetical protein